jgi:plastocyanin
LVIALLAASVLLLLQVMSVAAAEKTVVIKADFRFVKPAESVSVGDTVTWTNEHPTQTFTVVEQFNLFQTEPIPPGESRSITFEEAGAFIYRTAEVQTMAGLVIVTAADAEPSPTGETPSESPASPGPTQDVGASPTVPASQPPTDADSPLSAGNGPGSTPLPLALMLFLAVATPAAWILIERRTATRR